MNTHELGRGQEQRVADWMRQQGFYIVEQNFRCKFGEIDLIAKKEGYLIFVEVKYRVMNSMACRVKQWTGANGSEFPMRQFFI